jgi:hypothetical protein
MGGVLVLRVEGYPFIWLLPHLAVLLPAFPLEPSGRLGAMAAVLYVLLILLEDAEYVNLGWELVMAPCALFFPAIWMCLLVAKAFSWRELKFSALALDETSTYLGRWILLGCTACLQIGMLLIILQFYLGPDV